MTKLQTPHVDHKYIEALLNNDNRLIAEIYEKNSQKVINYVCKNSGEVADARDIFQEVLISLLHQAQNGFILTCPLNAFLFIACRNRWLNKLKSAGRKQVTNLDEDGFKFVESSIEVVESFENDEGQRAIFLENFKKLGDSCQEILGLSWTKNEETGKYNSLKDVAEILDRSYKYIRKKVVDCRKRLMVLINDQI